MKHPIEVIEADLTHRRHQLGLVAMLDAYAQDPMGGHQAMAQDVKERLIPGLQSHPGAHVFLAYRADEPVGIANCFLGFSTFAAKPLINIHDLAVIPSARRSGAGRLLLDAVCAKAKELGCCKVTLEVRDDNAAARKLYADYGFHDDGVPHRFWKLKV